MTKFQHGQFVQMAFQSCAFKGSRILHLSATKEASKAMFKSWRKFVKESKFDVIVSKRETKFVNGSIVVFKSCDEDTSSDRTQKVVVN